MGVFDEHQMLENIAAFGKKINGRDPVHFARKNARWFVKRPSFMVEFETRMNRFGEKTEAKALKIMYRLARSVLVWTDGEGNEEKELRTQHVEHYSPNIFDPEFHQKVKKEKIEKEKREKEKREKEEKRAIVKEKGKTRKYGSEEKKKKDELARVNPNPPSKTLLRHRH